MVSQGESQWNQRLSQDNRTRLSWPRTETTQNSPDFTVAGGAASTTRLPVPQTGRQAVLSSVTTCPIVPQTGRQVVLGHPCPVLDDHRSHTLERQDRKSTRLN